MMIVNRVKELRTAAGMTQKALADQLGVTVPTVSKWELGQRTPELEKIFRMTLIFGVGIDQIVQRTESAG
jgi:transcriptional regulator with XRE-family HTH domain